MGLYSRRIRTLRDVVDWRLCCGCGACGYASPEGSISLVNIENVGIRPRFRDDKQDASIEKHSYCPGYAVTDPAPKESAADHEFGRSLQIWEGYATDPEIRFKASSGGLLSALSLYCLKQEGMRLVLHSAMDEEKPWLNKTVVSRTRDEIVRRTGSRYAPSSPCEGLQLIEEADGPCVFIGKPCDVAAVAELRKTRLNLDRNLGLVLTFFCAGTPSTAGTLTLLDELYGGTDGLTDLRYRGGGWPGQFKGSFETAGRGAAFTYLESWGRLTGFRPLRCNLCPDGLGRLADLSCGDAWHRYYNDGDAGRSLVLVRTSRGRELLHRAMRSGFVTLQECGKADVLAAQASLLQRRRELHGRVLALTIAGIPVPAYSGFSIQDSWAKSPIGRRSRSVLGMLRRILTRRQWQRDRTFHDRLPTFVS